MPTIRIRRAPRSRVALGLAVLALLLLAPGYGAQGATINVPADFTTIQAAVNNASPNDVIVLATGTYTESVDLDLMGSAIAGSTGNLTIRAATAGTVTVDGGGAGAFECSTFSGRLRISGLNLDADGSFGGAVIDVRDLSGALTLDDLLFGSGYGGEGVFLEYSGTTAATVEIRGATFLNPSSNLDAIEAEISDNAELDLIIEGCAFIGMRDDGIKVNVQSPSGPTGPVISARIADNDFFPFVGTGNAIDIDLGDTNSTGTFASVLIEDNQMNGTSAADILVDVEGDNTIAWLIVRGNTIANSNSTSIQVTGSTNQGNKQVGILIDGNSISHAGGGGDGIVVRPSGQNPPSIWDVLIRNNAITSPTGSGIFVDVDASQSAYTLNVDLRNNSVTGAGANAYLFDHTPAGSTVNLEQGSSSSTTVATVLANNGNAGTPVGVIGSINVSPNAVNDNRIPVPMGGRTWADVNENGIRDSGEPAVPGVIFSFSGTPMVGGSPGWTTHSDLLGAYRFPAVLPGSYTITTAPPLGALLTTPFTGPDPTVDSNFSSPALTASVTLTAEDTTVDAGFLIANPPSVTCPGNVTKECLGSSGTPHTLNFSVTDPGGLAFSVVITVDGTAQFSSSFAAGTAPNTQSIAFPFSYTGLGDHVVEILAANSAGLEDSCSLTVTLEDTAAPVLGTCPSNTTVECTGGTGTVVSWADPTATDTCDPAPTVSCSPASSTAFPLGMTTITCTATDASGNSSTCTFDVTVQDTTSPVLTGCPTDITAECTSPSGAVVSWVDPGATDLCDPSPVVVCSPASGSTFSMGTTTVTCTATDVSGNSSTCTFDVTVQDTTPPTLVDCPTDITVECTGPTGTVASWIDPTATDLCDPNPTVTCSPPSGTAFALGTTTVTCTATDASGNSSTCTFDVIVVDTTPPVITASVLRNLLWPARNGLIPVGFAASALDVCDGSVGITVDVFSDEPQGSAPYAPDATGTTPTALRLRMERAYPGDGRVYLLRATATDASGNVGVACRTVIVPVMPVGTWILAARAQATAAESACLGAPTAAPLPYALLSFTVP